MSQTTRLLLPIAFTSMLAVLAGCSSTTPSSEATSADDLEARRQHIKQQETKVSEEAQARKDRSTAILHAEKVPVMEQLPLIEIEVEKMRRKIRPLPAEAA